MLHPNSPIITIRFRKTDFDLVLLPERPSKGCLFGTNPNKSAWLFGVENFFGT
ncbi:hypothetical protein C7382_10668 [Porphyromonas loveana]|uniref:Uncharacterized protein n=1 Tax=Porphyromonas loveana TaxID=1884669 RepID=A0A2U1FHH6_9PORP|nr:hypothetical protein C7382_10668 [Porphyromonas loveana]